MPQNSDPLPRAVSTEAFRFHSFDTPTAMPVQQRKQSEEALKIVETLCRPRLQPWAGSWGSSATSDLLTHDLQLRNTGGILNILGLGLGKPSREVRAWLSSQWGSTFKTGLGYSPFQ